MAAALFISQSLSVPKWLKVGGMWVQQALRTFWLFAAYLPLPYQLPFSLSPSRLLTFVMPQTASVHRRRALGPPSMQHSRAFTCLKNLIRLCLLALLKCDLLLPTHLVLSFDFHCCLTYPTFLCDAQTYCLNHVGSTVDIVGGERPAIDWL